MIYSQSQLYPPIYLLKTNFKELDGGMKMRWPGFEPGSQAWQAHVLTRLDYHRPE